MSEAEESGSNKASSIHTTPSKKATPADSLEDLDVAETPSRAHLQSLGGFEEIPCPPRKDISWKTVLENLKEMKSKKNYDKMVREVLKTIDVVDLVGSNLSSVEMHILGMEIDLGESIIMSTMAPLDFASLKGSLKEMIVKLRALPSDTCDISEGETRRLWGKAERPRSEGVQIPGEPCVSDEEDAAVDEEDAAVDEDEAAGDEDDEADKDQGSRGTPVKSGSSLRARFEDTPEETPALSPAESRMSNVQATPVESKSSKKSRRSTKSFFRREK